jgi:hypothetical protein
MKPLLLAVLLALAAPAGATLTCNDSLDNAYVKWNLGQSWDGYDVLNINDPGLVCFADGKELTYIQRNFTGLRGRNTPELDGTQGIYWQGDDAVFIVNNL